MVRKNSKKIVIFYSSIGNGHIVAAQAIQQEILRQDASANVLLQDIRSFMSPAWRKIDEKLFWFIVKYLPETFDNLFLTLQTRGNRVPSLSLLPNNYPEEKVLAFLESQAPDAVLATHYGAAQVLGTLRERELLAEIRIGWLHTDFFEGYFPRISKRIDRTFLGHPELEARWRAAGVPPEKVTTSGMPVQISAKELGAREHMLGSLGLATGLPTILLTGGREGIGNYCAVVESIAKYCHRAVQIIAVCGTNERLQSQLASLGERLSPFVALKTFGLLSHGEMLSLMCAADLLITKAGGMTPSEAFATGIPTILLDVVSGHERVNAAMFVRSGLAELASEAEDSGAMVESLLADSRRLAVMLEAQRTFRESIQVSRIAEFALDDSFVPVCLPSDFGSQNGTPVTNIGEALAGISGGDNANVELLLSYATSRSPQRVVIENPFGHLAIRINDIVYSSNHFAGWQTDPNFLQHLSHADYLYGVQPPSASQLHASTYGMAYGRETLGLRVSGISASDTTEMVAEIDCMEKQFHEGLLRWAKNDFNCADVVARILSAGGYDVGPRLDWLGLPSMPLDTFERARSVFEEAPELHLELVAYRRVPGAQAAYHFSRFPLSIGHPLRSAAQVLISGTQAPLEMAVSRQVVSYFGDRRLSIDNLHPSVTAGDRTTAGTRTVVEARSLELALVTDLRRLLGVYAKLPIREVERVVELASLREMQRLVDHGQEIVRIATEQAVKLQLRSHGKQFRTPSDSDCSKPIGKSALVLK